MQRQMHLMSLLSLRIITNTDNGSSQGSRNLNAGKKSGKISINEGGSRLPLFMRLPGTIKAGLENNTMTRHYDIFLTLADFVGVSLSKTLNLDGRSLLPLIQNPESKWA